jgi:ABC-type multidrug transport system ATPase subunit
MISAHGLTKRYGSVPAVAGLTFDVAAGKVTGFLGPNGAGKSTTMRVVMGLDRPTAGTATVNGKAYADLAHARGMPVHHLAEVEQALEHAYLSLTEESVEHQGRTPELVADRGSR